MTLQKCLDSYLRYVPRKFDEWVAPAPEVVDMQRRLHRSVFLTFLRMSTHKESKVSPGPCDRSPPPADTPTPLGMQALEVSSVPFVSPPLSLLPLGKKPVPPPSSSEPPGRLRYTQCFHHWGAEGPVPGTRDSAFPCASEGEAWILIFFRGPWMCFLKAFTPPPRVYFC